MDRMIKFLIYSFLLIIFSSCSKPNNLDELLFQKYHEEFIIRDSGYNFELGLREFTASPKRFPDLEFYGRYNDSNWVYDYYPETLWNFESVKMIKDLYLNEKLKSFVRSNVAGEIKEGNNGNVVDLSSILKVSNDSLYIQNYIYLFKDINQEKKEKLLDPILRLINYYNQFPGKKIFMEVYFWDKAFTQDKDPDSLNFTFNIEQWDGKNYLNADNTDNKKKFIKHSLPISFITPITSKLTIDSLFSYIQPYTIKGNEEVILK